MACARTYDEGMIFPYHYIVLLGDVGAGKSKLAEKISGQTGISSSQSTSCTKVSNLYESFDKRIVICDTLTGFIAGMPFLGDLETELRAKRLETPRVKVPKGSVGLTEQFANVYTFESPGGWNIIGNTPSVIFDSSKENNPNLINPGDAVTFEQITKDQYNNYNE